MDGARILFSPIQQASAEWVKFQPHSATTPIHPTCPAIYEPLDSYFRRRLITRVKSTGLHCNIGVQTPLVVATLSFNAKMDVANLKCNLKTRDSQKWPLKILKEK